MSHLTNEEIVLFLAGRLNSEACRRAVRHLLGGCAECQRKLEGSIDLGLLRGDNPISDPLDDPAYDAAIDRAITKSLQAVPRWQEEEMQLRRLLDSAHCCPTGLLGLPPELEEDFHGRPLVEALIAESHEERFRDLERMRLLAFAAVVAARNLDPRQYSPVSRADLRARAWAELANTYRVGDDFEGAESALARAEADFEEGSGDPLLLARLLDIEASLRSAQRRLEDTLELLESVQRIYLELGETHLAGRALITRGINTAYDDRPYDAVQLLQKGLVLIDPERDPRLTSIGRYELLHSLVDCGEFRQAGQALLESGLREAFADDPLNLAKLRWLEGKIHAGLGKLWRAEQVLTEVRDGFRKRGQGYDSALVGLDLAAVWLQQDKHAAVRELAEEVLEKFAALGIQREGIKAVHYLREACRREMATPALVQRVSGFLRRLEWKPQLRFTP